MKISVVLKCVIFLNTHFYYVLSTTEIKILGRQSDASSEVYQAHCVNEGLRSDLPSISFIMRNPSIQSIHTLRQLPYEERIKKVVFLTALYYDRDPRTILEHDRFPDLPTSCALAILYYGLMVPVVGLKDYFTYPIHQIHQGIAKGRECIKDLPSDSPVIDMVNTVLRSLNIGKGQLAGSL